MKKTFITIILSMMVLVLFSGVVYTQKAAIKIEAMSIHMLHALNLPNPNSWDNVSTGLRTVGVGTMVWMTGWDTAGATIFKPALTYSWSLGSKPSGSLTVLESTTSQRTNFRPDMAGNYTVNITITTTAGSHSTSQVITAANYTGTNWQSVTSAPFNCASCHTSSATANTVYNPWKTSDHATKFKRGMDGQIAAYWGESCFKCHTTGYNKNALAANNGFDEVATNVGFVVSHWTPWRTGLFDSLLTTDKKNLSMFGTIGCESCHGPKDPTHFGAGTQPLTINSGVCAQCHDEPWRQNRYVQWENTTHSGLVASPANTRGFTGASVVTSFDLNACTRCHDGQAFVNWTKGKSFDPRVASGYGRHTRTPITCQTCHDPHSMDLRKTVATSDTLGNGFNYSSINLGKGKLCANCHKYRRGEQRYITQTNMSSTWGPHYAGTTDILLGQNGHTFGTNIPSSVAHRLVENSCVGCHMAATTDTGTVARDKIGMHTWTMSYKDPNTNVVYDNVKGCIDCHTGITKFTDILSAYDYDGNGVTDAFVNEVEGLKKKLAMALPPVGLDSVNRSMISASPDSNNLKKAFWNYLYVKYDGSQGVHNPKYVIGLLQRSITTLTGVEFEPLGIPENFELAQNYPNPFNPTTVIKYNVPVAGPLTLTIYNSIGQEVAQLVNGNHIPGNYSVEWNGTDNFGNLVTSGVYLYRLSGNNFKQVKKMLLVK